MGTNQKPCQPSPPIVTLSKINTYTFKGDRANTAPMKTSTTAAANATAKIESRVKDWGFYGTIQENLKLSDKEAADAFDRAVRFTANRLIMELPAARRFLDSRLGRHLADVCHKGAPIETTLDSLYVSWKREVREFRANAINSTDEAFYA